MRSVGLALCACVLMAAALVWGEPEAGSRWWKGNTHTHTLWSDGDGAPELVAAWYREHGYHFVVLSDHDVLSEGERWFAIDDGGRLTAARVAALRERFGADSVRVREREGGHEMRLATLAELRERFEEPGRFLFVQGEEISDSVGDLPVHVNALNLGEVIPPQGGASVREALNRNVDAVIEQGRRLDRATLAHVNHPNFKWAVTWEDIAHVRGDRFFEVFNANVDCHNGGDAERPGTEEMWDRALTLRLTELDLGLLYGLATDDTHHSHREAPELSNAGRGWVMVRASALDAGALVAAMRRGDFYSSSGVTLRDVRCDGITYALEIEPEQGVEYETRFVGTRRRAPDGANGAGELAIGAELSKVHGPSASYRFRGDELYVRAVVTSSKPHPRPHRDGEREMAWTQPAVPAR
jgi:hypothetical protein